MELIKENILLIKKITFKYIFCFTYYKKKLFYKIQFPNIIYFMKT